MVLTLHTVWNSFKWRTQYYTTLYRSSLESKIPGQIEKIFEKKKKLNMFEKNGWWEVGGKGRRRLKRWMEVGIGAWEREREGVGTREQVVGWQSCGAFRRSERWIKCRGWTTLVLCLCYTRVPPFSTSSLHFWPGSPLSLTLPHSLTPSL